MRRSALGLVLLAGGSLACGPPVTRLRVPVGSGDTLRDGSALACSRPESSAFSFETWQTNALHWRASGPGKVTLVCPDGRYEIEAAVPKSVHLEAPRTIKQGEVVEIALSMVDPAGQRIEAPRFQDVEWSVEGGLGLHSPRCEFPPWCTCGGFHGRRCIKATGPGPGVVRARGPGWTASAGMMVR
jgi:hypothetical protein